MIIWSSNLEDKTDDGVGNLLYVIISQSFFDVYGRRAHFNVVSIQLRKETPSSSRLPHFHSIVLIFAWNNAADKRHPERRKRRQCYQLFHCKTQNKSIMKTPSLFLPKNHSHGKSWWHWTTSALSPKIYVKSQETVYVNWIAVRYAQVRT